MEIILQNSLYSIYCVIIVQKLYYYYSAQTTTQLYSSHTLVK